MQALRNYMYGHYSEIFGEQASGLAVAIETVLALLLIVAMWRVFTKAGEAGWKAIIPIYNVYELFKISMGSGWYFLLLLIPLIRWIAIIMLGINLARAFNKSGLFALGIILLMPIFMIILGFSRAQYVGPGGFGNYDKSNSFSAQYSGPSDFNFTGGSSNSTSFDTDDSKAQTVEFEVEEVDD